MYVSQCPGCGEPFEHRNKNRVACSRFCVNLLHQRLAPSLEVNGAEKPCCTCGIVKPLTEYHRAASMKDGHFRECKTCRVITLKAARPSTGNPTGWVPVPAEERFFKLVRGREKNEHWEWLAALNARGFPGKFQVRPGESNVPPARFAYDSFIGGLTSGQRLKRACEFLRCVNPWHHAVVALGTYDALTDTKECSLCHQRLPSRLFTINGGNLSAQCTDCRRMRHLARKYGLTLEQFSQLEQRQGGGCAICHASLEDVPLSVDHDHLTGTVRGLLCGRCNSAIGMMGDDPTIALSAAAYLQTFWQQTGLPA